MGTSSTTLGLPQVLQRAAIAFSRGHWVEAEGLARGVLDRKAEDFDALKILALIAARTNRPRDAEALWGRAVAARPHDAEAHSNRGSALMDLGRLQDALASHDRALQIAPNLASAHLNRGVVLQYLNRLDEALESYDRALEIKPDSAAAHNNRGNMLKALMRPSEALDSYDRALKLKPDVAEFHNNRGSALKDLMRLDEALESYDRALRINPNYAEAHSNRGVVLREVMRLNEALASYDRALHLKPDFAEGHFNRSQCRLLTGDLRRGWEDYEWRWAARQFGKRDFTAPLWLGKQSLAGKTILLHSEQGFGDTLQFCRYAKFVGELGARVLLEVPESLAALLGDLAGVSQLIAKGDVLPPFDYHCPLMSLPLAFETTLESIPSSVPYVRANPEKVALWRSTLGRRARPSVGLVWSGGLRPNQPRFWAVDRRRNVPLSEICSLRTAHVDFYSLQKGEPAESEMAEQRHLVWPEQNFFDFTSELHDFSDTAALIENLDLVISVDTATAHLAAAMGKPVWILNRFDTCWRWLSERTDSPWYPTVKLFRQPAPGDWQTVLARVRDELMRY